MRILVADQNALLLAAITATFGRHCDLVTTTRRDVCLEQAERQKFDVVIACDKLADYTGLELLSEIAGLYPETLLIFAATPARLEHLGNRLELFGLLETLSYPLTPRKLLEILQLANRIVPRRALMRKVRHVVLESEWDTGERLGLIERELEDRTAESTTHEGWSAPDAGAAELPVAYGDAADEEPVDEFFFAPAPATRPTANVPAVIESALIELPPSAVPIAPVAATGHVSDEVEVFVSNDPSFEQPEVPPEPRWAEDGAANDILFEGKPPRLGRTAGERGTNEPVTPTASGSAQASRSKPAASAQHAAAKQPKVRKPSQPTAAQLAAFERARARRNAERDSGLGAGSGLAASSGLTASSGLGTSAGLYAGPGLGASSLTQLARMASTKRPLDRVKIAGRGAMGTPKRSAVVVGSGLVAVLVLAVLTFGLLRAPSDAKQHLAQVRAAPTPFGPSGGPAGANTSGEASVDTPNFTPAPPPQPTDQPASAEGSLPQNSLDPDGAGIAAPPPPPALEHPGPMEPPSSMHVGPPLGMVPPGFEPDPGSE